MTGISSAHYLASTDIIASLGSGGSQGHLMRPVVKENAVILPGSINERPRSMSTQIWAETHNPPSQRCLRSIWKNSTAVPEGAHTF